MRIRNAALDDIPALVEMGAAMLAESLYSVLSYDRAKLGAVYKEMITANNSTHCFFVADDSQGRLIGFFIGRISEYFFSRNRMASSIVMYVDPEWRGNLVAVKFIHAFRAWALNRDAIELCIGIATGVTVERSDLFLRRLGFELTGGNYSLLLPGADAKA